MAENKFPFRFRKLLELREQQQKMAEMELAEKEQTICRQKALVDEKEALKCKAIKHQREASLAADLLMRSACAAHLRRLNGQIAADRKKLDGLVRSREQARGKLRKAAVAREALENYRDKKRSEFFAGMERLDERVAETNRINGRAVLEKAR